jgi:DUF4097 and DUF4098 domain-containing protein YvlB
MKTTHKFRILAVILATGIVTFAQSNLFSETSVTETRTFNVGDNPHLVVEASHASISVRSGESDTIEFNILWTVRTNDEDKAEKSFAAFPAEFEQGGDSVTLKIKGSGKSSLFSSKPSTPGIDVTVTAPPGTVASIDTASGDLTLEGIDGDHSLNTASGDIVIESLAGDLRVDTASGDIQGVSLSGNLKFSASSGDIDLSDVGGEIKARTASGDITIERVSGALKANAASGDIRVAGSTLTVDTSAASGDIHLEIAELTGPVRANTASGDVFLALGSENNARVTLQSNSRRVSSSIPLGDIVQDKKQRELRGVLGDGKHEVHLQSAAGDVDLEQL